MLALQTLFFAASIAAAPTAPTEGPTFAEGPTVTADSRHGDAIDGTWDAQMNRSVMHLNVRVDRRKGFYQHGRSYKLNELAGYRKDKRNVGFELRRNAGTIRFDGATRETRAAGTYEFTPHDGFKKSLEKMGFRGLESERLLTIALHDLTIDDVRYIQRAVDGSLSTVDLVRLLEYGINEHFVKQAVADRGELLSVNELIKLRTGGHGAD